METENRINLRLILSRCCYFFFTGIILSFLAFYNNFPLVYSDTGTYVQSMFSMVPPVDRPLGYGFFLRIVTWQETLWLAVIAQGIIGTLLLYRTLQTALNKPGIIHLHFVTVVLLALLTPLSWVVGQVMPDVFSGFMVLGFYLLWFRNNNFVETLLLSFLVFISVFSHFTYLLLGMIFLGGLTIRWFIKRKRREENNTHWIPTGLVLLSIILVFFIQASLNSKEGRGFKFSTSSNVFFTAQLMENGILKDFLNDNCGKKDYPLCKYKDNLPPGTGELVWDYNSFMYKDFGGWEGSNAAWAPMVRDLMMSPQHFIMVVKMGIKNTMKQFFSLKIGDGIIPYLEGGSPYHVINQRFGKSIQHEYLLGRQNHHPYDFSLINIFWYAFLVLSVLLIYFGISFGFSNPELKAFFLLCISGCFFNAMICGTLVPYIDRYQTRIAWLICLCGILYAYKMLPVILKPWMKEKDENS